MSGGAVKGLVVPGLPHPLLCPERNEGWMRIRDAFLAAREEVLAAEPDVLLVYSTMWPSVVGHQIQAQPEPEWVHVDELFHDLGSIPYRFRIDAELAHGYLDAARERGLHARTVAYHGFPIDTGSVVTLKLLTPENEVPAVIVSSNVYSDRAETIVLGKAASDALARQGKRAVAIAVTTLSNRLFTDFIDPAEDRIHSGKDDEWNRKILEFLADGRLEDVSQLSREIHRQIRVKKVVNFKPMWWLAAVMGQHNRYEGVVHDYAPIHGAGAAVVSLTPSTSGVGDKEYDEEDVEVYAGDRTVLERTPAAHAEAVDAPAADVEVVRTAAAPKPVGAYPHARRVGDLLFLSGIGPRRPEDDAIPGGPVRDDTGAPLDYDIEAQTRQVIENVRVILEEAGASLADVQDVTVFLIDMDRDFAEFNRVYGEAFQEVGATRTTLSVNALPTPIGVELKVIARAPEPGAGRGSSTSPPWSRRGPRSGPGTWSSAAGSA
ncbi:MAG: Rid family hydrolase [Planctomycetota bacterium]